jgi:hypothetical protein
MAVKSDSKIGYSRFCCCTRQLCFWPVKSINRADAGAVIPVESLRGFLSFAHPLVSVSKRRSFSLAGISIHCRPGQARPV